MPALLGLRNPELVVPVDEEEEYDAVLVPARTAPDVLEPEEPEPLPFCATSCAGLLPLATAVALLPLPLLSPDWATKAPAGLTTLPEEEKPEDSLEELSVIVQIPVP